MKMETTPYPYHSQKFVNIAPAPENSVPYKKYNYKQACSQSVSIARRNARERSRVKQVNDGFTALKKKLPAAVIAALSGASRRGSGKKLSKVDTLRMVVEYIRYLENILEKSDEVTAIGGKEDEFADERVFGSSPYSDDMLSPTVSDCSGVSTSYSQSGYLEEEYSVTCEAMKGCDSFFDPTSWWENK